MFAALWYYLCIRWMDEHGPVTPGLLDHLRAQEKRYDALVFFLDEAHLLPEHQVPRQLPTQLS